MRHTLLTLAAGALLTACGASAQVRVERYNVSTLPDNSVVYALPETYLYAAVTYRQVTRTPGELALYADRYLGVSDAILEPETIYEPVSVQLGSYGLASDSLRFAVQFRKNSSATNVTLTEDGRLVAINVASLDLPEMPQESRHEHASRHSSGDLKSVPPEYISATTFSKKAAIAAQEIYRLRDSRTAVLAGETDQPFADGAALRIAVQGLDEAEQSLTARFLGTSDTTTYVRIIRPLEIEEGEQVAYRFSRHDGLLEADDLRGEPVYLSIEVTEEAQMLSERDQKKKEKQLSKGIVYLVPGRVEARLTYAGRRVAGGSFPVAQLGALEVLEGGLFTDKKMETAVRLDPTSGGILKVDATPRQ